MVIAATYCIIGLAILSMCLNLIQDEIVAKFTWIGRKLGLVSKEEDEDFEDDIHAEEMVEMCRSRQGMPQRPPQINSSTIFRREKTVETSAWSAFSSEDLQSGSRVRKMDEVRWETGLWIRLYLFIDKKDSSVIRFDRFRSLCVCVPFIATLAQHVMRPFFLSTVTLQGLH